MNRRPHLASKLNSYDSNISSNSGRIKELEIIANERYAKRNSIQSMSGYSDHDSSAFKYRNESIFLTSDHAWESEIAMKNVKPTASEIARAGWIWWKSSLNWRRAFAILTYNNNLGILQFYHSEEDQRPYRVIELQDFTKVVSPNQPKIDTINATGRYEFNFISKTGEVHDFAADSPSERNDWVVALGILIERAAKFKATDPNLPNLSSSEIMVEETNSPDISEHHEHAEVSRNETFINQEDSFKYAPESHILAQLPCDSPIHGSTEFTQAKPPSELKFTGPDHLLSQISLNDKELSVHDILIQNIVHDQLKSAMEGFQTLLEQKTNEIVEIFSKTSEKGSSVSSISNDPEQLKTDAKSKLSEIASAVMDLTESVELRTNKLGKMLHELVKRETISEETWNKFNGLNTTVMEQLKNHMNNLNSQILSHLNAKVDKNETVERLITEKLENIEYVQQFATTSTTLLNEIIESISKINLQVENTKALLERLWSEDNIQVAVNSSITNLQRNLLDEITKAVSFELSDSTEKAQLAISEKFDQLNTFLQNLTLKNSVDENSQILSKINDLSSEINQKLDTSLKSTTFSNVENIVTSIQSHVSAIDVYAKSNAVQQSQANEEMRRLLESVHLTVVEIKNLGFEREEQQPDSFPVEKIASLEKYLLDISDKVRLLSENTERTKDQKDEENSLEKINNTIESVHQSSEEIKTFLQLSNRNKSNNPMLTSTLGKCENLALSLLGILDGEDSIASENYLSARAHVNDILSSLDEIKLLAGANDDSQKDGVGGGMSLLIDQKLNKIIDIVTGIKDSPGRQGGGSVIISENNNYEQETEESLSNSNENESSENEENSANESRSASILQSQQSSNEINYGSRSTSNTQPQHSDNEVQFGSRSVSIIQSQQSNNDFLYVSHEKENSSVSEGVSMFDEVSTHQVLSGIQDLKSDVSSIKDQLNEQAVTSDRIGETLTMLSILQKAHVDTVSALETMSKNLPEKSTVSGIEDTIRNISKKMEVVVASHVGMEKGSIDLLETISKELKDTLSAILEECKETKIISKSIEDRVNLLETEDTNGIKLAQEEIEEKILTVSHQLLQGNESIAAKLEKIQTENQRGLIEIEHLESKDSNSQSLAELSQTLNASVLTIDGIKDSIAEVQTIVAKNHIGIENPITSVSETITSVEENVKKLLSGVSEIAKRQKENNQQSVDAEASIAELATTLDTVILNVAGMKTEFHNITETSNNELLMEQKPMLYFLKQKIDEISKTILEISDATQNNSEMKAVLNDISGLKSLFEERIPKIEHTITSLSETVNSTNTNQDPNMSNLSTEITEQATEILSKITTLTNFNKENLHISKEQLDLYNVTSNDLRMLLQKVILTLSEIKEESEKQSEKSLKILNQNNTTLHDVDNKVERSLSKLGKLGDEIIGAIDGIGKEIGSLKRATGDIFPELKALQESEKSERSLAVFETIQKEVSMLSNQIIDSFQTSDKLHSDNNETLNNLSECVGDLEGVFKSDNLEIRTKLDTLVNNSNNNQKIHLNQLKSQLEKSQNKIEVLIQKSTEQILSSVAANEVNTAQVIALKDQSLENISSRLETNFQSIKLTVHAATESLANTSVVSKSLLESQKTLLDLPAEVKELSQQISDLKSQISSTHGDIGENLDLKSLENRIIINCLENIAENNHTLYNTLKKLTVKENSETETLTSSIAQIKNLVKEVQQLQKTQTPIIDEKVISSHVSELKEVLRNMPNIHTASNPSSDHTLSTILRLTESVNSTLVSYLPTDLCNFRPVQIEQLLYDIQNKISDIQSSLIQGSYAGSQESRTRGSSASLVSPTSSRLQSVSESGMSEGFENIQKLMKELVVANDENSLRSMASASALDSIQHTLSRLVDYAVQSASSTSSGNSKKNRKDIASVVDVSGLEEIKDLIKTLAKCTTKPVDVDDEEKQAKTYSSALAKLKKDTDTTSKQLEVLKCQRDELLEEICILREQREFLLQQTSNLPSQGDSVAATRCQLEGLWFETNKLEEFLKTHVGQMLENSQNQSL
ncbi:hypothetical protein HK098_006113 [Nowakowskiella sp. JEL0407]|nr:hypothetical protein HK098_006113 [Nowakowskiella sp. JEL0407]